MAVAGLACPMGVVAEQRGKGGLHFWGHFNCHRQHATLRCPNGSPSGMLGWRVDHRQRMGDDARRRRWRNVSAYLSPFRG